jgi:hypothetical protein
MAGRGQRRQLLGDHLAALQQLGAQVVLLQPGEIAPSTRAIRLAGSRVSSSTRLRIPKRSTLASFMCLDAVKWRCGEVTPPAAPLHLFSTCHALLPHWSQCGCLAGGECSIIAQLRIDGSCQ